LTWPNGDEVVNGAKLPAGSTIGEILPVPNPLINCAKFNKDCLDLIFILSDQ